MIYLFVIGCSQSLLGDWQGLCLFDDGESYAEIDVDARITRDNGYILEGTMDLLDWNDDSYNGELTGDHSGKYVMMRTDIESELGTYRFRIETERFGMDLEGSCTMQSSQSPGGLTGSIILRK